MSNVKGSIMTPIEILTQARDLIADESSWTTGVAARDMWSHEEPPESIDAVCWCAVGALWKIGGQSCYIDSALGMLVHSCLTLYNKEIDETNDELGHSAIIAAYNHAIKELSIEDEELDAELE
jgi:hypothetical protein